MIQEYPSIIDSDMTYGASRVVAYTSQSDVKQLLHGKMYTLCNGVD